MVIGGHAGADATGSREVGSPHHTRTTKGEGGLDVCATHGVLPLRGGGLYNRGMAFVLQNSISLIILLILLVISGVFSGAETVLFSLSRHERARMKKSKNRLEVMAANLVENPRSLLTSLLMGNMTCNIIVFVVSSLLLSRLSEALAKAGDGLGGEALVGVLMVVPPLMVTYAADVFPKVIGSLNNTRIAR